MFKKLFGRKSTVGFKETLEEYQERTNPKAERFEHIGQPVQAIVEALESRPKTFQFSETQEESTNEAGVITCIRTEHALDTVTGLSYKKTKIHSSVMPYRVEISFPFKASTAEWRLLQRTVEILFKDRKDRYNEILRARVYRKYL
jgi:hypothetical protein